MVMEHKDENNKGSVAKTEKYVLAKNREGIVTQDRKAVQEAKEKKL